MPFLVIVSVACFAGAVSIRVVDPIVPEMARDWAVSPALIALIASAFAFPYALSQPILGPVADAVGKARVIKIGLAVLTVATLATALSPTLELVFATRIIAGVAGGAIIPVALAMVGDRVPLHERQIALSHLLSAMLVAQLVSLIGSGWIASLFGWRWAMGAVAIISLIAWTGALIGLAPRRVARDSLSFDSLKDSYRDVFANPKAKFCYAAVFAEGMLIFGILPFIATMLEARGAGGIAEAGLVIAGMGIGGLAFTLTLKHTLARLGGMFNVIRLGAVAVGVGFAGVAMQGSWPFEMVAFSALGFGFYAVHNALQTQATELSSEHRGAAVALHAFFFFLGHAAGPPIYSLSFPLLGESGTVLIAGISLCLGALFLAHALETRS
ncbi:MAG: MFS transporter [Pseudomonadota bacterium]